MPESKRNERTPNARGIRTREAVLDAAFRLFAERGISGTSMHDIAARAGMGRRTVYRYFASVEAVAVEIFKNAIFTGDDSRPWPTGMTAYAKIEALARGMHRLAADNEALARFFIEYDYHFSEADQIEVHELIRSRPNRFASLLEEGVADGSVAARREDIPRLAVTIPNAILALVLRVIYREAVYKLEYGYDREDAAQLIDLILAGIRAR